MCTVVGRVLQHAQIGDLSHELGRYIRPFARILRCRDTRRRFGGFHRDLLRLLQSHEEIGDGLLQRDQCFGRAIGLIEMLSEFGDLALYAVECIGIRVCAGARVDPRREIAHHFLEPRWGNIGARSIGIDQARNRALHSLQAA